MELNKMEREFSEKLSQREIKPSAGSWDRLDAMLSVAEQQKPVRKFNWLYIAASFVGFLLVATIFWNPKLAIQSTGETVVATETKLQQVQDDLNNSGVATTSEAKATGTEPVRSMNHKVTNAAIADNSIHKSSPTGNNHKPIHSNSVNQNQINPEVISPINQTNEPPHADELLAVAQSQLPASQKAVKVSAKSLLSQVDGAEQLTFREKVLLRVGKNYKTVKEAIANRNVEEENH